MSSLQSEALIYAQNNFKIFPLKVNSKSEQVLKSWKEEATNDINQVTKWWLTNTQYNIGLKTGSGLIVIDIDCKNGKNGLEQIKPFLADFPKTRIAKTCHGGYHFYYKVDREVRNYVNLLDGVDVRGDGGYVLAPPSIVDDKSYTWVNDLQIANANDAVYKLLERDKLQVVNHLPSATVIQQGVRNETLFRLGCMMQAKGMNDESIKASLEIENMKRCNPPLSKKELASIIKSITTHYDKPESNDEEYKVTWVSALEMSKQSITESPDIIENLLPIGVTLISAPSKMGKTFLCMQMANAIAKGDSFLGYQCKKKNAYYIALEDPKDNQIRRLKNSGSKISQGYDIEFCEPYQVSFNLEKKILNYLHFNPELGVVIVDTFEKIRDCNERTYSIEYKEVTHYHELAMKYGISIILVMHTIKNINYTNIFANISGSAGTLAAADGLMVLIRNQMDSDIKELHLDGKGIPADIIKMKQNNNMTYQKVDTTDDLQIEPDLLGIIHYIIIKRKYEGACERLGVEAGIKNCNGKHIRCLLDNNKDILKSYFIRYSMLRRTSHSRKILLEFYGEDSVIDDANDEMTKI
ncbi:bifunctional DNA primase/polymerase [uncultured Thomasclavelia sp.]|uniref:bifunctional DNA primase/polymerase n=1 Tax=uncultured Thomasclavelia sp. TaxID=3025759 RepID=UPI00280B3BC3|nr:bifunctional DNA primase/polymerase [uncultured Thomasclavelia sp.]